MELIVAQGRASVNPYASYRCVMNGAGGDHCAIGHLLDDETRVMIDTRLGDGGLESEIIQTALPPWMLQDLGFYLDLQRAHDIAAFGTSDFVTHFRRAMEGIREKYNLT
jgi:hypothetical protein